ncbi:NAD-dependent epimerase/dehydratase family protein [Persicobacter psychrovividus]|uniref:NAD-dependent epimerase n=1 Tax=Persicobacter psychrovividus TaxID=387638 RepID=A0ABN6LAT1_9BACT|nr:NAD-dependent epimerase [Persicobacter psychrovividus]
MIFITGATGFVGSYICRALLLRGEKLRCLKRPTSSMALLEDVQHLIEWVEGSINDILWLDEQMQGVEKIIHAAAMVSFDEGQKEALDQNIELTKNLVNVALSKPIKQFLQVSSIAAIGQAAKGEVISEKHHWENSMQNVSDYAYSKHQAEMEVWRGIHESLPGVIVNPSVVLGPCPFQQSTGKLLSYIKEGNTYYTDGSISLVDVRDVAEAVVGLIENNTVGERFILNAGELTYLQFFSSLRAHWQLKGRLKQVGKTTLSAARFLEGTTQFFTDKKRQISQDIIRQVGQHSVYSSEKIEQHLDFHFRPLAETIAWTCASISSFDKTF